MADPDWQDVAQGLADVIAAGTYDGQPINASVMGADPTGLLAPPCARVLSPSLGFNAYEEGYRVDASEWPVMLYTGEAGGMSIGQDMAFLTAVLDALEADPTCGGTCVFACPVQAPSPEPFAYAGAPGAEARLLRRELTIQMNH